MSASDDLTTACARRDEVQAKLEQETDEEDRRYYALVIAQWDRYITQLEAKHGGQATVQTQH